MTKKQTRKTKVTQSSELKQLARQTTAATNPFEIGKNYLIRTVTMIDTGRVVAVTPTEVVLEDAAWIADTGRFTAALRDCNFIEVEMFPKGRVIVGRAAIIDACQIDKLPVSQK